MPKSKRDRVVSLTQTAKKGKELKTKLIESLRECVDSYAYVYVFSVENMRNTKMKELRAHFSTSRFFLGKNKIMQLALGRSPQDEHRPNIYKLSAFVTGKRGLFFTNVGEEEIKSFFADFNSPSFARSGFVVDRDFIAPAGELPGMPVTMEPTLRKLGLPVRLLDGKIVLPAECVVCKAGDALTPEQCKILELLELQIAEFRLVLHCLYRSKTQTFTQLADSDSGADSDEMVDASESKKPAKKSAANGAHKAAAPTVNFPGLAAPAGAAAAASNGGDGDDDEDDDDDQDMEAMDLDDVVIMGDEDAAQDEDAMEVDTPRRSGRSSRSSSRPKAAPKRAGTRSGTSVSVPQPAASQRGKGRNTRGAVRRGR